MKSMRNSKSWRKGAVEMSHSESKNRQSVKLIMDNNLFMLKYALRYSPLYLFMAFFQPALAQVEVFIEHIVGIKFVTDTIQYGQPFSRVLNYIIIVSIFIASTFIVGEIYRQSILPKGKEKLHKAFRMELYEKAAKMDLACYDNPEFYNEFVFSLNEATNRMDKTMNFASDISTYTTVLLTTGTFFILFDKLGLLFVLVSFFSSFFIGLRLNKTKFKMDVELNSKIRKRAYIHRVFYLSEYAKEIRLNPIASKLKKDFRNTNSEIREIFGKYSGKLVFLGFIQEYICNSFLLDGLYVIYILFITMVKSAISYGSAIVLLNSAWRLKRHLQGISSMIPNLQENSLYIEKLRSFLSLRNRVTDQEDSLDIPKESGVIELKNVSFAYDGKKGLILKDISLKINPNEKIAFVGYNGAGKTTLMKILMRLYDVSEGEILLNSHNIKEYRLDEYRGCFGTVFQNFQIFAGTILENVVMSSVPSDQRDATIAALERSGFGEKLKSFKKGLDTPLTREFEDNGTNLSGGEAQKLAIARAFYKPCSFIILDEPSSALDPISEYQMNKAMFEAADNKTVIFISHRLSTTRMADRIYMLEDGRIIEQGNHEELMSLNGKYAEMFNLQAKKYRIASGQ